MKYCSFFTLFWVVFWCSDTHPPPPHSPLMPPPSENKLYKINYANCIKKKKKALYLSVNVFSTKVLIGDTIFYDSNWRRDLHFMWSSEPRKGLACCSAKGVTSFLGYFKTLSICLAPGIEPATSRSAVNMLYWLS